MKDLSRVGILTTGILVVLVAILLLLVVPATARDVPFPTKHTVDAAFAGASSVSAADVDGDGDLDLLGAGTSASDLIWWENRDRAGTAWSTHAVPPSLSGARSVLAADVDGDGNVDLFGGGLGRSETNWMRNTDGTGTAWARILVDESFGAQSVHAADVDGDGDVDLLGTESSYPGKIRWWENTVGDGSLWSWHLVTGSFFGAWSVYTADLDGDGDQDVLGAAFDLGDIAWWENIAGNGTTWLTHTLEADFAGAVAVRAADVDGDGDVDVLGAARTAGEITWWENTNGSGTAWTEHPVAGSLEGAESVHAADVDGDGDLDVLGTAMGGTSILAASQDPGEVIWWENTAGDGTLWMTDTVDGSFAGARSVYAADVDGDGDQDVLGAASDDHEVAWWENTTIHRSALYPTEHTIAESFDGAALVRAADVDGNGAPDILGAATFANEITWWEFMDDGGLVTMQVVSDSFSSAVSVCALDVDVDGDLDIAGLSASGELAWWENDGAGGGWAEHPLAFSYQRASSLSAGDINGDGIMDLVGTAAFEIDFDVYWWENDGDGVGWVKHNLLEFLDWAGSLHAADIDGDGDVDMLAVATYGTSDYVIWWENTSGTGGSWSRHNVTNSFSGASATFPADLDGDGDLDILGAAATAGRITWWENMGGSNTFTTSHTVAGDFDGAADVTAADLDGDGDFDILGAAATAGRITWWENKGGSHPFTVSHDITHSLLGVASITTSDLDRDGDLDIVAAGDNVVAWWENRGGQFALSTTDIAPEAVYAGQVAVMHEIAMTHRGRAGDTDEEFSTLELLFESSSGEPLTSIEANALIENLYLYLDDGSGTLEEGVDTLITTVHTLSLVSGTQTVVLPEGTPTVRVVYGSPLTYFVAIELATGLPSHTSISFQITHVTEGSSTAKDRDYDIPLDLEYTANVSVEMSSIAGAVQSIDPESGGTLVFTDAQGLPTIVEIPPGAVVQTTTLVFTSLTTLEYPLPPDVCFTGRAFDLDAYCPTQWLAYLPLVTRFHSTRRYVYLPLVLRGGFIQGSATLSFVPSSSNPYAFPPISPELVPCTLTFRKPATITIHYSDADVICVSDEESLRLYYWTGSLWQDAANTCPSPSDYDIDIVRNVLRLEICHLSRFALGGR